MADRGIVQKDEMSLRRPALHRVIRKRELSITLLSDCLASSATPQ
jgi:hypothetical protein